MKADHMTDEDFDCWLWSLALARRAHGTAMPAALDKASVAVDRRDAELMKFAQRLASCGPCGFELHGIPCRGWDVGVMWPARLAALWNAAMDNKK